MKASSPIMVQYQHPIKFLGMPPVVFISIAFFAVMFGVMMGVFLGVAIAFVATVALSTFLYIYYLGFAKGDRHADKVYLSGLLYWFSRKSQYLAGDGK